MVDKSPWESFLATVEPHLPEYLHWNEICWTFVSYLAEVRRYIHRWARGMEAWEIVVNTVMYCFFVWLLVEVLRWIIGWLFFQDKSFSERMKKGFFRLMRKMPFIKEKIATEMEKTLVDMEDMAFPLKRGEKYQTKLPAIGRNEADLMKEIEQYVNMRYVDWEAGNVSGTVYSGGKELSEMLTKVYSKFVWSNPLHPDIFPGVRKMEAEVVRMTIKMFNGGENACGTMTLGGTESLLVACKAYRDWGYEKGIKTPEILAPVTAHAAFDKAAHYFGIKLVHIPLDKKTLKCDMKAMRRAITRNTVMLVGSAPNFPHGMIDPIEEMAKLAKKYNIGMHVDCCLGGFLVPFMKKAGYEVPPFDFSVDGVTSISADTHKYGYAPKGSSVIMYSNKRLLHFQIMKTGDEMTFTVMKQLSRCKDTSPTLCQLSYDALWEQAKWLSLQLLKLLHNCEGHFSTSIIYFVAPDWPGGIYACPSIPGSRPGAVIAATWATMMYFGESGYVESTRKIIEAREKVDAGIRKIKGLYVMGRPLVSVVAFSSDVFDIFFLSTELTKRGWNLNTLQYPPAIHVCFTRPNSQPSAVDRFLKDVTEMTAKLMKNPAGKATGMGAIYGISQTLPDRSMVSELACGFIDILYDTSMKTENGSI